MKLKRAVEALSALAQETRLGIFRLLVREGQSGLAAGVIAERLSVSPQRLSFHLKDLSHAGLIQARHDGRFIFYAADFVAMNDLLAYLTENCCGSDAGACAPDSARCVPGGPASVLPRFRSQRTNAAALPNIANKLRIPE